MGDRVETIMRYCEPNHFQFTSSDGLPIECVRWNQHAVARGVVQIAHGLGEHVGRYAELADFLTNAGLVVYGNDHRGHGRTAPSSQHLGDFGPAGFDQLVQDMVSLTVIAKGEQPGKRFILLGHSMGSFAAQQYVLDYSRSIDGLVLFGSGALDHLARLAQSAQAGRNPLALMDVAFEPARTPFDWLSRDEAEVDKFMNDPLCFAALNPASTESFLAASVVVSEPNRLRDIRHDLLLYLVSGSEDPVGQQLAGLRILEDRYRNAGITSVFHDFYPGGRHEMLHELNRSEVYSNLLAWIFHVLGENL